MADSKKTIKKLRAELKERDKIIATLLELAKSPPRSSAEAGAKIAELTGIKRSPTQIREFLKKKKSGA